MKTCSGMHILCALMCRQAEAAEARAQAAQGGAATAVRGARQAGAALRGKETEVTLSDLHAAAEARLSGWSAWIASRNSMDESLQEEGDDTVRSLLDPNPCAKESKAGASLFEQGLCFSAESAAACTVCNLCKEVRGSSNHYVTAETQVMPDCQERLWCAGGPGSVQAPDGRLPPGRHAGQHGGTCGPCYGGRPSLCAGKRRHMLGRSPLNAAEGIECILDTIMWAMPERNCGIFGLISAT